MNFPNHEHQLQMVSTIPKIYELDSEFENGPVNYMFESKNLSHRSKARAILPNSNRNYDNIRNNGFLRERENCKCVVSLRNVHVVGGWVSVIWLCRCIDIGCFGGMPCMAAWSQLLKFTWAKIPNKILHTNAEEKNFCQCVAIATPFAMAFKMLGIGCVVYI